MARGGGVEPEVPRVEVEAAPVILDRQAKMDESHAPFSLWQRFVCLAYDSCRRQSLEVRSSDHAVVFVLGRSSAGPGDRSAVPEMLPTTKRDVQLR
jgi:hypothetical protein